MVILDKNTHPMIETAQNLLDNLLPFLMLQTQLRGKGLVQDLLFSVIHQISLSSLLQRIFSFNVHTIELFTPFQTQNSYSRDMVKTRKIDL